MTPDLHLLVDFKDSFNTQLGSLFGSLKQTDFGMAEKS